MAVAGAEEEVEEHEPSEGDGRRLLLYRAQWIKPFRLLLRLKVGQAAGAVAVANLMLAGMGGGDTSSVGSAVVLLAAIGGMSATLW